LNLEKNYINIENILINFLNVDTKLIINNNKKNVNIIKKTYIDM